MRLKAHDLHPVAFTLNGRPVKGRAEPRMLLSDFLRHELGATGTHVGCEHGVCGACTVRLNGALARSCLTLAVQAEGGAVETIEGLSPGEGRLSTLQAAFARRHGLQCGFCTPGILMTLDTLFKARPEADEAEIREALSGHLCRCAGYQPILEAALEAAALLRQEKAHA